MVNNLHLGPDAEANHRLALLRNFDRADMPIATGMELLPGMFFSLDPESLTRVSCLSSPGKMLTMDFTVAKPGRWQALHIGLGALDLRDRQVLGVLCKTVAQQPGSFRLCLRSNGLNGAVDCFFSKAVLASTEVSSHLDVIELETRPDLPVESLDRELILFFKPESAVIDLVDMRIFAI